LTLTLISSKNNLMNETTRKYNTHIWRDAGRWLGMAAAVGGAVLSLTACDDGVKPINPNSCHRILDTYHKGDNLSDISTLVLVGPNGHASEDKVLEMNRLLGASNADAASFLYDAHTQFIVPANSKVGVSRNCPK
jgi:hypothetical protein